MAGYHTPMPEGYCAAAMSAAASTRTEAPGTWWRAFGPNASAAAINLSGTMTEAERGRLVQGFGWDFTGPRDGYYVGNVAVRATPLIAPHILGPHGPAAPRVPTHTACPLYCGVARAGCATAPGAADPASRLEPRVPHRELQQRGPCHLVPVDAGPGRHVGRRAGGPRGRRHRARVQAQGSKRRARARRRRASRAARRAQRRAHGRGGASAWWPPRRCVCERRAVGGRRSDGQALCVSAATPLTARAHRPRPRQGEPDRRLSRVAGSTSKRPSA
eukprot:875719-Prymnesium_polylepis.1